MEAAIGIEKDVLKVTKEEAFELLVADCLRDEPFPREIQVIGQAMGWATRIQDKAKQRGWKIAIDIEQANK